MRKIFTISGVAAVLLAPMHLEAQYNYAGREAAMLPPYCKYTQTFQGYSEEGKNLEKIKYWYAAFGGQWPHTGVFDHMHHYCEGLMNVNTAKFFAKTSQERKFNYEFSINQFDYMIKNSLPDEKMLPEFHTKKGESLVALGKSPRAVLEFERAIQLKPDYWPPYAAMSDLYKNTGNIKMAREQLERGLATSPDAAALKRRLAELEGGKGKPRTEAEPGAKPPAAAVK